MKVEDYDIVHGQKVPRLGTPEYAAWENRPEAVASRRAYGPSVYGRAYDEASRRASREGTSDSREDPNDRRPEQGPPRPKQWSVQTLADVRSRKPTAQPEIIKGMLRKRGVLAFTGIEGGGKSLILQDLAARVALGSPWLGIPTIKSRVGLLTLELEDADVTERADLLSLPPDSEHGIRILTLDSIGAGHIDISQGGSPDLERLCEWGMGLDLIILDPKANLYDGAEDREGHVRLLRALDRLRFATGAGLALASHVPKVLPKEVVHTARGDTSFTADVQTVLALRRIRGIWTVIPAKVRIGPKPKPIHLATTEVGDLVLPLTVVEAPADPIEGKEGNLAIVLDSFPETFTAPGKIHKDSPVKVARSTFNSYLEELQETGDIEDNGRRGRARKYRKTSRPGKSEDYPEDSDQLLDLQ